VEATPHQESDPDHGDDMAEPADPRDVVEHMYLDDLAAKPEDDAAPPHPSAEDLALEEKLFGEFVSEEEVDDGAVELVLDHFSGDPFVVLEAPGALDGAGVGASEPSVAHDVACGVGPPDPGASAGSSGDVPVAAKAKIRLEMPGGHSLTWYTYGRFKITCKMPGHTGCTKERVSMRSLHASGRPMGHVMAWFDLGPTFYDGVHGSAHREAEDPSFMERFEAREKYKRMPAFKPFFDEEAPKLDADDSEPEEV
jgi:hypothetical protein